jgi:hypothetical protein
MEKSGFSFALVLLGAFLAVGLIGGGYFVGQTMYNAKVGINIAEAKGLAERRVKSDRADWQIRYSVSSSDATDRAALYKHAEGDQNKIVAALQALGFEAGEIQIGAIDYTYQEFRDENQNLVDQKYILNGVIDVETDKVDQVSGARAKINALIAEGLNIENQPPRYRFTKLNDIKPEMLREATQNASVAANEFAASVGAKVGKIRDARQGAFGITDAGEEYGDTRKIEKDVRVVTTISFYITD